MKFIDTHIHLQDYISNSAPQIVEKSLASGVCGFVCVSSCENDWAKVMKLSETYPDYVVPALGIHPWQARSAMSGWVERLEKYLKNNRRVQIGETGLDRLRDTEFQRQAEIFEAQIALAERYKRLLLVHTVKSTEWLSEFWDKLKKVHFVFHSFTGPKELAAAVIGRGGFISFSQSILKVKNAEEIVCSVPEERLLFETDGPYQSLQKGTESTPCFLPELAMRIAEFRQESPEALAETVYKTSRGLFYGK